jgi:hypothetical protein
MVNKPDTRTKRGKFKKGTSGNPSGRPTGSRNRATLMAEQFLEDESEQLVRQAVSLAKGGNILALRLCLERILPARRERTITVDLSPAQNALDIAANYQELLAAVSDGRITPGEAQSLSEVLDRKARLFETVDTARRLQALEEHGSEVKRYHQQQDFEIQRFVHENPLPQNPEED